MSRLIVISGGGTGIGRATARTLANDGDRVLIVGRRQAVLDQTASEINEALDDERVFTECVDVSIPTEVEALVARIRERHQTVDGIVNNAGGGGMVADAPLAAVAEGWLNIFNQNVMTAVLLTAGLAPILRRPGGRIVLVSSMSSRTGGGGGAYAAAKAALNGWALALTAQYAREGITANVVAPGYTPDTELFKAGMPKEIEDKIISRIAVGRAGRSQDTAAAIRFLLSPEASFVTSQVLEVHGGTLPPNM